MCEITRISTPPSAVLSSYCCPDGDNTGFEFYIPNSITTLFTHFPQNGPFIKCNNMSPLEVDRKTYKLTDSLDERLNQIEMRKLFYVLQQ